MWIVDVDGSLWMASWFFATRGIQERKIHSDDAARCQNEIPNYPMILLIFRELGLTSTFVFKDQEQRLPVNMKRHVPWNCQVLGLENERNMKQQNHMTLETVGFIFPSSKPQGYQSISTSFHVVDLLPSLWMPSSNSGTPASAGSSSAK